MDDVLADINVEDPTAGVDSDEEMADVAPRAVQKQEKQKNDKRDKKESKKYKQAKREKEGNDGERKKKKRKHKELDGDEISEKKLVEVNGEEEKKTKRVRQ